MNYFKGLFANVRPTFLLLQRNTKLSLILRNPSVKDFLEVLCKEKGDREKRLFALGFAGSKGRNQGLLQPSSNLLQWLQTRKAEFQSIGLFGSFRKIAQTEGLLGFYRGNGASVARIVPYAALHYMAYEQYRRWVILGYPDIGRGPVLDLVAGSFAGGTAVMFTYPLDLVRTKLAYQVFGSSRSKFRGLPHPEHFYEGILDCISKIYKRTGIRGLYRGVGPTLYGIFPYSGLKFYFYEEMKTHVPEEHKKDIIVKLACGSVAGLLGQTVTYPLDVVRRQMQVQALSSSDPAKGTLESLVMIIRNQGWRQLFSGLSINYMKVVPSVAIGFTVYDAMKSWLKVPSRDETAIQVVSEERSSHHPSSRHCGRFPIPTKHDLQDNNLKT